jgi:hypothetical protein
VKNPPSMQSAGSDSSRSELEALRTTCWRQSHEIQSLSSTIDVYRRGASTLAAENTGLRSAVARLRAQDRSRRPARTETAVSSWVEIGVNACGLVLGDRLVVLVCWRGDGVAAPDRSGGRAPSPGFWWFSPDRPSLLLSVFEAQAPTAGDWVRARALAARAYFETAAEPVPRSKHALVRTELLSRRWLPGERDV